MREEPMIVRLDDELPEYPEFVPGKRRALPPGRAPRRGLREDRQL